MELAWSDGIHCRSFLRGLQPSLCPQRQTCCHHQCWLYLLCVAERISINKTTRQPQQPHKWQQERLDNIRAGMRESSKNSSTLWFPWLFPFDFWGGIQNVLCFLLFSPCTQTPPPSFFTPWQQTTHISFEGSTYTPHFLGSHTAHPLCRAASWKQLHGRCGREGSS